MIDNIKPAVNSLGWEIQQFTEGRWQACSEPYLSRAEARDALECIYRRDVEYRVYEALRR